ncbi:MAG TPA: hypothetical protein VFB20_04160 [Burkholderiales bacterium]|nr:hypothetical protein [Burkholderiales bacterium]
MNFPAALRRLSLPALLLIFATAAQAAGVSIVSPQQGETVHDNLGKVRVALSFDGGAANKVRLVMDGAPLPDEYKGAIIRLENIERGEHVLVAQLLDEDGNVVTSSAPVTFYMWRASARFPGRRVPPR